MNWTLGGGWHPASDRVNDFGCQQRVGLGFPNECFDRSVPRSHTDAQELEVLNIPKLLGVRFSGGSTGSAG